MPSTQAPEVTKDPKDVMIAQLADQLEEAAINLSLPCNGGAIVTYKLDLVKRARALIGQG